MNYLTHQLINPQEINLLKKNLTLKDLPWEDGKKTAGNHAAKVKNNLQLNAERKNLESAIQNKNISRSEFLPSISVSQEKISTTSTGRTNQNGLSLADSNSDTENKNISLEQVIFSGFKGVNTFKKSELETQKDLENSIEKYQDLLKLNNIIEKKFQKNTKNISKKTKENISKIISIKHAKRTK